MHHTRTALVAVACLGLTLTACGRDDDPPTDTPTTTANSMTEDSMTDDSMTEDSMTGDSMVDDSMAGDSMAEDSMAEDSMTGDSMAEDSMTEESMTGDSMSDGAMSGDEGADGEDGVVALAAWQTMPITDTAGATFTLAELIGTPVLVETFATWCSNCRAQLADTQTAAATLGDEATVLALSVETDLSPDDVASYAVDNGFTDVRFAVMSPELLAAFAEAFGTTVANPPSTPKIIITAEGISGELQTGPSGADDLVDQLRAAA